MANEREMEDQIPPPQERLKIYREYARQALQNAEASTGIDVQAFLAEAVQWERAAAWAERAMTRDTSEVENAFA